MLLEFSVGNFRSFGEEVTLSFLSTSQKSRDGALDGTNRRTLDDGVSVLLSAAVYGANASGKSNLFRALHFVKSFVLDSARAGQAGDPIDVVPFRLHPDLREEPSTFEIVLQVGEVRYRYGFEADREKIHREWLFHTRKRERSVFSRNGTSFTGLKAMGLETVQRLTRPNALFLSVAAQFNDPTAITVLSWFKNLGFADGAYDLSKDFTARQLAEETYLATPIRELVRRFDLDIIDLRVSKITDRLIETQHSVRDDEGQEHGDVWFNLKDDESVGTNKLFAISGPLVDTLLNGRVMVIDEFDARLHPIIGRAIVELFHDPLANPKGAQLLIMTHDTNLLDRELFRRDQIWFVEKDRKTAQTRLFSLVEFQVRNDAAFEAAYLHGRYGALPSPRSLAATFVEAGS